MFTGIVEELGRVRALHPNEGGARIEFDATEVLADAVIGASIAVNGCCLTIVELGDGWWAADAVSETLDRTGLGSLRIGDPVNLERPLRLADRLGGHLVQGHVDGVGELAERAPLADGSTRMRFRLAGPLLRYLVEKGSITVDGISLTVAALYDDGFDVAVIPHTLTVTNLGAKQPGDPINLEVDVLAKYVERLLVTDQRDERRSERARSAETEVTQRDERRSERARSAETGVTQRDERRSERARSAETGVTQRDERRSERARSAETGVTQRDERRSERARSAETGVTQRDERRSERARSAETGATQRDGAS